MFISKQHSTVFGVRGWEDRVSPEDFETAFWQEVGRLIDVLDEKQRPTDGYDFMRGLFTSGYYSGSWGLEHFCFLNADVFKGAQVAEVCVAICDPDDDGTAEQNVGGLMIRGWANKDGSVEIECAGHNGRGNPQESDAYKFAHEVAEVMIGWMDAEDERDLEEAA